MVIGTEVMVIGTTATVIGTTAMVTGTITSSYSVLRIYFRVGWPPFLAGVHRRAFGGVLERKKYTSGSNLRRPHRLPKMEPLTHRLPNLSVPPAQIQTSSG